MNCAAAEVDAAAAAGFAACVGLTARGADPAAAAATTAAAMTKKGLERVSFLSYKQQHLHTCVFEGIELQNGEGDVLRR